MNLNEVSTNKEEHASLLELSIMGTYVKYPYLEFHEDRALVQQQQLQRS